MWSSLKPTSKLHHGESFPWTSQMVLFLGGGGGGWARKAQQMLLGFQFFPHLSFCSTKLLCSEGRHKASPSSFTPRSSRGERGICPFAGKTHCLLCCPCSSLSVVKFLTRLFHHPQPVPLSSAGAVLEFRLQHCHICHMVLRLSCFFYPCFKDNEPNTFLMSLV